MSVNESFIDQQEDVCDLPDLYNRELLRKKNSYINANKDVDVEANTNNGCGGYREWKAKNGINTSDRMVSSLGKVLQDQGIVVHNESDFYEHSNYREGHSNPVQEKLRREQHRLNASEPCYTPHQFRRQNQEPYRSDMYETDNRRHYQNETQNAQVSPEAQYSRCADQCYSQNKSIVNSPTNQTQGMNLKLGNHPHNYYNEAMYQDIINSPQFRTPPVLNHYPPHPNQYRQCHPPPMCCYNPNETPHRQITPQRSPSSNKTDTSMKKFCKILRLLSEQLQVQSEQLRFQSEQLSFQKEQGALLEKQISKLVELSLNKDSNGKISEERPVKDVKMPQRPQTCDVDVMTDLPCKCKNYEREHSSSESEPESNKPCKKSVDDSLTLHGVEIPISREEASSPPVSMHIDMQEFQSTSSSETEESDTTEDESEPISWTLYDNVVGQVNNILKTANKKKKKRNVYDEELNLPVEHMKRLGLGALSAPDNDNYPKRVTFNEGSKEQQHNLRAQSEISMNFNALASKYLTSAGAKVQDISMCNVISGNTNMSLATMRYLERHQIATKDVDVMNKRTKNAKSKKGRNSGEKAVSKFLDITAIRQQPKLLPKDI